MMSTDFEQMSPDGAAGADLAYLESRVRAEAGAAAAASSLAATLIHVSLATAYARRFGECTERNMVLNGRIWAEEHRVW